MLNPLLFIPACAVAAGAIAFCIWLWREGLMLMGIIGLLIVVPLSIIGLMALAEELWTDHPSFTLDKRSWACSVSHVETSTIYVVPPKGGVALPITSHDTVCDQYTRS